MIVVVWTAIVRNWPRLCEKRLTARADVPITPLFGPGTWRHMHLGSLFFTAGQKAAEAQLSLLGMLARPSTGPEASTDF
jgi:hypothetical protein